MKGVSCVQRLNKDISELFSSDFNCTASHLTVFQNGDSLNEPGSLNIESKVFEGPYRGGRFHFCFNIPANYPFKPVEVYSTHPIWHPNIDLKTGICLVFCTIVFVFSPVGKVAVPIEWSPVLTLHAFALSVQMVFLFAFLSVFR
jgi:ubiquitin-protein ligase